MVHKKMQLRDYFRCFITEINKKAGVKYNSSKLMSVKACEEYILKLVENLNKIKNNKLDLNEFYRVTNFIEF